MKKLLAWFPQAGRLHVKLPKDREAAEYRDELMDQNVGWIEMEDGSFANSHQIVRLQVEGEE